jgi:hypothetical protein
LARLDLAPSSGRPLRLFLPRLTAAFKLLPGVPCGI